MSSVWPSTSNERPGRAASGPLAEPSLTTLIYRSRAVVPLTDAELDGLLRMARARNRWESVTGVLIHDRGRFFQWLEGPAAGLSRIWQAICADPRHTDIELVSHMPASERSFADWDMKLARRHDHSGQAVEITDDLIAALSRHPQEAPGIIASLASRASALDEEPVEQRSARAIVMDLVEAVTLPRLFADGAFAHLSLPPPHGRAIELAQLLTAADPLAAFDLIQQLNEVSFSLPTLFASVLEPAARGLGDLWMADDCSEDELMLGLSRLQTAVRRLGCMVPETAPPHPPVRAVLVATQPGELHRLGCAMDAEALWQAGWDAHCEFPATDAALQRLLSDTWFDALDLSLSCSLRREHWLPRMAETIARARDASRNPALVIMVGGRVFFEQGDASLRIGADASSASSWQTGPVLVSALPSEISC